MAVAFEAVFDICGVEVDGGIVVEDFVVGGFAEAELLHESSEGGEEVPDLYFLEIDGWWFIGVAVAFSGGASESVLVEGLLSFEGGGSVFESFVFEEFLDEFVAWVGEFLGGGIGVIGVGGGLGEEHSGLDFHECSGHDEEIAGDVDVEALVIAELLEVGDVGHVGVGDASDGDIVDIEFIALDQVEEEIERAVIDVELNAVLQGTPRFGFMAQVWVRDAVVAPPIGELA